MKKILVILLLMVACNYSNLFAASATGHENITQVEFVKNEAGYGKLLIDISPREIESGYKAMGKNRFFGWKEHYFCIDEEIIYVGEVIFSKSNRTNQPITVNYILEETKVVSQSVKISGSINAKAKGGAGKIAIEGGGEIKGEKENKNTVSRNEETKFNVIIKPNCKVSFRVTGEARVTNGLSKYSLFWTNVKKGSWEIIEIETYYYELFEETL